MNLSAAPAWTINGTRDTLQFFKSDAHASPGPIYNLSGQGTKRSISYTTGTSQRFDINHGMPEGPGPQDYNPSMIENQEAISFPKSPKMKMQADFNPPCNEYDARHNFVKPSQPNFSMGSKYPSIMDDHSKNPGPGYYQAHQSREKLALSRKAKFGSAPRFSAPSFVPPGPGDYNIQVEESKKKKSFFSKARKSLDNNNGVPGPGEYEFKNFYNKRLVGDPLIRKETSQQKKQRQRKQKQARQAIPVQSEETPNLKQSSKAFSFGKQRRQVFMGNELPGPCDYRVLTEARPKPVSFAMSSYRDHNQARNNPGPGAYQVATELQDRTTGRKFISAESKKFTIARSKSTGSVNKNPGVGRYNTQALLDTKYGRYNREKTGSMIGKSGRTDFVSKNVAGVGDYDVSGGKKGGVSIPKAARFSHDGRNPGPGDYYLHSTISNFNLYRKRT